MSEVIGTSVDITLNRDSQKAIDLVIDITGGVPGVGLPTGLEDYFKSLILSVLSNLDEGVVEQGDYLVAVKSDGSLAKVTMTGITDPVIATGVLNLDTSNIDVVVTVGDFGTLNLVTDLISVEVTVNDGMAVMNLVDDSLEITVTVDDSTGTLNLLDVDMVAVVTVNDAIAPVVPEGRISTHLNQFIDSNGDTVRLKTVNWFGGEGENHLPNGLWGGARRYTDIIDDIASMGFNCIRFPFSGAWVNPSLTPPTTAWDGVLNPEFDGLTAHEILDLIIAHCTTHDIYIVLDHHRAFAGGGADGSPVQSGYTLTDWCNTWAFMATRYKDNLTVIGADVHNEPHNLTWAVWADYVETCADIIHAIAPDWVIFVEGSGAPEGVFAWWGSYLKEVATRPIVLSTPNKLAYAPHEYGVSVGQQAWLESSSNPNVSGWPLNLYPIWRDMWGFIYEDGIAPIWIGEFGGFFGVDGSGNVGAKIDGTQEAEWVNELVKYLNGDLNGDGVLDIPVNNQGMSFSYWCYNPNSGDTGGLVQDDWTTHQTVKLDLIAPLMT